MKKVGLIFVCLLALTLIFCSGGSVKAASQKEILENLHLYPDIDEYEQIFFENLRNQDLDWSEKAKKIIGEYLVFIVKHPGSEFIDEAKLRIAEFLELSRQKEKALPFLNDIIKNHPQADYYSLSSKYENGAKTAGWALYYRAIWFPRTKSTDDLERIIKEYPENKKAVRFAKMALSKFNDGKESEK